MSNKSCNFAHFLKKRYIVSYKKLPKKLWQKVFVLFYHYYIIMEKIVGRNLKKIREFNQFTAQHLADCLGINRSTYSNYEAGLREMPMALMEKAADFLGIEVYNLYEEDERKLQDALVCAFCADELTKDDIEEVTHFKSIVKNYLKICEK